MNLSAQLKSLAKRLLYFGSGRHCTVCKKSSRAFLPAGVSQRSDAKCPWCGALERHRLTILFLNEKTDLFDGKSKRFLHVAPESMYTRIFSQAAGDGYLTADLMASGVMEKMDITDIQHPDESFDVIYCSHVLEHVPDDRKAISEFYRTLKSGGWAILNVPITADKTFEDPSITDPKERLRLFGQDNHVRRYGPDYKDRLAAAGFVVTRFSPEDLMAKSEVIQQGMSNEATGDVFYCAKE